jgi:predicted ester cyclase
MGIPPTGRTVEMGIMDTARLVDGKVVETWHMGEDLGMLQQLGVLQSPEPTNR